MIQDTCLLFVDEVMVGRRQIDCVAGKAHDYANQSLL
jgi:hypothetical protein